MSDEAQYELVSCATCSSLVAETVSENGTPSYIPIVRRRTAPIGKSESASIERRLAVALEALRWIAENADDEGAIEEKAQCDNAFHSTYLERDDEVQSCPECCSQWWDSTNGMEGLPTEGDYTLSAVAAKAIRDIEQEIPHEVTRQKDTMSQVWTPRELIESLSKWAPDEPIDVRVIPKGIDNQDVILMQGTTNPNMIKLK